VAIFGRNTARRRLKRATQQALSVPTFDAPADCTPWVIGGLWPAELEAVTPATAPVAEYLKNDLQRIADSANQRLRALHHSGLPEAGRRAEEARIINVGRAFAVLRVESTVRHLRSGGLGFVTESLSLTAAADAEPLRRPVIEDTQVIEAVVDVTDQIIEDDERTGPQAVQASPEVAPPVPVPLSVPKPVVPEPVPTPVVTAEPESDDRRLARLLAFVARQEPGLRWAIGEYADGTTVLVTDLAYGWIPPGVDLPAGVGLVAPARRGGRVAELLGEVVRSAVYHPGDPFGPIPHEPTVASPQGRAVPPVDDLGWKLVEATHWRDGLPRMVHTLAKAGAARTGVVEAEVEVLRVHCDTARYQLMAQYPDVDPATLSNCLLLAATEAIAVGDQLSANYHFAWFEALSTPPTSHWGATT
jgi:hypothetical protein